VAAAVPVLGQLVGAIAGIVFMARSKIGPALALWATCFIALALWSGIGSLVVIARASSDESTVSTPVAAAHTASSAQDAFDTSTSLPPSGAEPALDSTPAATAESDPNSADTRSAELTSCGNLKVNAATTTCSFAQNVFWEYWSAVQAEGYADEISVYSDAVGRWLPVTCRDAGSIVCETDAGGEVRFSQLALAGYTQEMADAYAVAHTVHGG
jgi:hypothetical protein